MRTGVKAVVAAVLFTVVLALTLPTDQLVRLVLTRVPVPDGHLLTFQHARLRPWGLVLDAPAYRRSDGSAVLDMDWLRVRPSWTSLWRDRLRGPGGGAPRGFWGGGGGPPSTSATAAGPSTRRGPTSTWAACSPPCNSTIRSRAAP